MHARLDDVSGALLTGGELREWTDAARVAGTERSALVPLVRRIRDTHSRDGRPASVLLVGPRAAALAPALTDRHDAAADADVVGDVTIATRALDDVRAVATSLPGVRLVAGAADRLDAALGTGADAIERAQVVVALGGPDLLLSPDSPAGGMDALLTGLARLVAPGGALLVDADNRAGLGRLVRVPEPRGRDDGAWQDTLTTDSVTAERLGALGAGTGLEPAAVWAAWPERGAPAVLATANSLGHESTRQLAVWAVHRHLDAHPGRPVLTDPARLSRDLLEGGLGHALADAWVVLLTADGSGPLSVPDVVVTETWSTADAARDLVITGRDEAPHVDGRSSSERSLEPPRPAPTLAQSVVDALEASDRDRVRELLTGWTRWLDGPDAPDDALLAVAVPANVALRGTAADGPDLDLVDRSWRLGGTTVGQVVALGLHDLAARVVRPARHHPFRVDATEGELVEELAVLAGRSGQPTASPAGLAERLAATGLLLGSSAATTAADTASYAELARDHAAQADELVTQRARATWLEGTLRARDRQIRVLERSIDLEASAAYRLVSQAARPVPALRRAVGRLRDRRAR